MISADNEADKGVVTLNRALVDGEKVEVKVGETDATKVEVDKKEPTKYNYTFNAVAATDEKQTITVTAKAGKSEKTTSFEVEAKEYTVNVTEIEDGTGVTVSPAKGKKGDKITITIPKGKKVELTVTGIENAIQNEVIDNSGEEATETKKEVVIAGGDVEVKVTAKVSIK